MTRYKIGQLVRTRAKFKDIVDYNNYYHDKGMLPAGYVDVFQEDNVLCRIVRAKEGDNDITEIYELEVVDASNLSDYTIHHIEWYSWDVDLLVPDSDEIIL